MFFLAGPTGSGKSDLAVAAAQLCHAEILGADAFQVYDGLPILTAQPSPELRARIPHHLIGEIPVTEHFDAARYRELALAKIRDIESRSKRALIVGGTGLYIRALTRGLVDLPSRDETLRAELEKLPLHQLQFRYAALDPVGFEKIDRQNPRRLIRAIEVTMLTGQPFSAQRADWSNESDFKKNTSETPKDITGIALQRDREELYQRIDQRVVQMFKSGVIEEVETLIKKSAPGPTASQAIGFAEISSLLRGEITQPACIAAIQQKTRRYAKRQLTWLRSENIFFTLNLTGTPLTQAAEEIARRASAPRDVIGGIDS
jgi:tRNA dimethylallyltransferase